MTEKRNDSPLHFSSREEIYRAKAERRKRLAALSIDEKVELMEKLQKMGRMIIEARKTLPDHLKK